MIKKVQIKEVGPRDGLQNEKQFVPTAIKLELIRNLISAGINYIEAAAFVNPKTIPQMADATELARVLPNRSNVTFSALVPNLQGFERAMMYDTINEVAIFTAASETFNQKNINASIKESVHRFEPIMKKAKEMNIHVRGYISTAFVCPYEGKILPEQVTPVAEKLLEMGCYEISIGDTIGKAEPQDIDALFNLMDKKGWLSKMAGHFHDTYGMALVNVQEAMEWGVSTFDSSVGGLGGCPYAPGAGGNLATEDLVSFLNQRGVHTGVNLHRLIHASEQIQKILDHPLSSKVFQSEHQKIMKTSLIEM